MTSLGAGDFLSTEPNLSVLAVVALLEGPAVHEDGTVYFSDLSNDRIMCLRPTGQLEVFRENAGRANGNVFDLGGHLVTCEGRDTGMGVGGRVTRTDLASGHVEVVTDQYMGQRYNSPNDVTVSPDGALYFTDPRYGDRSDMEMAVEGVYRVGPDGRTTRVLSQPDIQRPNGVAVSPDGRILYVVDSNHEAGGNRKVWSFSIDVGGDLSEKRLIRDFAPGRGGDGIEVDVAGNLYVCGGILTPRWPTETTLNPPGVYVLTPDGDLLGRIPIPQDLVTNCCFGGADMRTLYVTAGEKLFALSVPVAGYHAASLVRRS